MHIKDRITVQKTAHASRYLSHLGADADGEFLNFAAQDDEDMYTVSFADTVVGLAQAVSGHPAFLYVYIFPQHRHNGFGSSAVSLLEDLLQDGNVRQVQTCFRCDDSDSGKFANRRGYCTQFSSAYMVYRGGPLEMQDLSIRNYQDSDFEPAHKICAEAFHIMRLNTGLFPGSTMEEPDTRAYWAKTASQRFVYDRRGEILGTVLLESSEIGCVAVKPAHQRKGIGAALVKYAVNRLLAEGKQNISLYCVVGNPARRLYDQLGFAELFRNEYAIKEISP